MLLVGKHITITGDTLQPAPVEKVYKALLNPKGEVAALLRQLQHIRIIDPNQYRRLKTGLPYMVCALFHPMVRRKENFLYTERFIIDIDHLSHFELDPSALRQKLATDSRVEMLFGSPGGDGLKVLFHLSKKITDSSYYAQFYKAFCLKFRRQYQLGGALDGVTHDVTRCCFVSFDPKAFYNPLAETITAQNFLAEDNFMEQDLINQEINKQTKEKKEKELSTKKEPAVLPDELLRKIKEKVGQRVRQPKKKDYIQPGELAPLIAEIRPVIESVGVQLVSTAPINYGRVIRVAAGMHWAELNIFYGGRGPSVVPTTKTGSNKDLVQSIALLLKDYFLNRKMI